MLKLVRLGLSSVLFTVSSAALACTGSASKIEPEQLTARIWQTTAVYESHDCDKNVIEKYPGVVGISVWDKNSNRFEYFNPVTGESRRAAGGAGYFFITGDLTKQINVFDSGSLLIRKLEKLDASEFTYSRMVAEGMDQQKPEVKIFVVHTPYPGTPVLQR